MPGFQTGFFSTLTARLAPADTTAYITPVPVVTNGRLLLVNGSITEWISYTGVTSTSVTGLTRNLSKTADPVTGGTGLDWQAGTRVILVEMHDQIVDKEFPFPFPIYTTTQRDALVMSSDYYTGTAPIIYNSTTTQFEYYTGSAWTSFATGTIPDATTTVGGKVKISDVMADPVAVVTNNNRYIAAAGAGGTPSATNLLETQYDTSNGSVKTATTISFVSGTKTIADSGNGLVTSGFKQGTQITITGSASNNSTFTIVSVAAGAIVVAETIVTESAGASVTITTVKADKLLRLDSSGFLPAINIQNATNIPDSTNLQYAVSTMIGQSWTNITLPIVSTAGNIVPTGWLGSVAGGGDEYGVGYSILQPSAGAAYAVLYAKLPGTGSLSNYQYSSTKDIRVKFYLKLPSSGADRSVFGLSTTTTAANFAQDQTGTQDGNIRFFVTGGTTLYAANSNGAATSTSIAGITSTDWNEYEIVYNPGTDIRFYVNGVLKATHTTNLPTTASQVYVMFANINGISIESTDVHVSIEK